MLCLFPCFASLALSNALTLFLQLCWMPSWSLLRCGDSYPAVLVECSSKGLLCPFHWQNELHFPLQPLPLLFFWPLHYDYVSHSVFTHVICSCMMAAEFDHSCHSQVSSKAFHFKKQDLVSPWNQYECIGCGLVRVLTIAFSKRSLRVIQHTGLSVDPVWNADMLFPHGKTMEAFCFHRAWYPITIWPVLAL